MSISFKQCDKFIDSHHINMYEASNNKLSSQYYDEYFNGKFKDLSFLIFFNNSLIGYVVFCLLDCKITWPGGGVLINFFIERTEVQKKYYVEILKHLSVIWDAKL